MNANAFHFGFVFEPVTYCGCYASALKILMDKQFVQISGSIDISETYDQIVFRNDVGNMSLKRGVPFLQVDTTRRPRIYLFFGIILYVHGVDRFIEQPGYLS